MPGSREPQGALGPVRGDRVARCLDETGNDLTTWVRQLEDDRGVEVPYAADEHNTVRVACWLLNDNLTSISTLDWCGDLVAGLRDVEYRLRRFTEEIVPGWYAGACRSCGLSTYVVPGLTWVTCSHTVVIVGEDGKRRTINTGCGATTYARDHLEVILNEARSWVAPPARIAEALVALIDTETSVPRLHDRIRQWSHREAIIPIRRLDHDGDPVGPKRYRLADVLDRLTAEGATRTNSRGKAAAAS